MYRYAMILEDKWKKAVKDVEEFNEMMNLIKDYTPNIIKSPPKCLPYTIPSLLIQ